MVVNGFCLPFRSGKQNSTVQFSKRWGWKVEFYSCFWNLKIYFLLWCTLISGFEKIFWLFLETSYPPFSYIHKFYELSFAENHSPLRHTSAKAMNYYALKRFVLTLSRRCCHWVYHSVLSMRTPPTPNFSLHLAASPFHIGKIFASELLLASKFILDRGDWAFWKLAEAQYFFSELSKTFMYVSPARAEVIDALRQFNLSFETLMELADFTFYFETCIRLRIMRFSLRVLSTAFTWP